jgi:hypothetical protein
MRRITVFPLLLSALLLGGCDELGGLGGRSIDGEWRARIDGEEVWVTLRDDRGEIRGSGDWGFDDVYVTGDRFDSDVYLEFEFYDYDPIDFEGVVRGREIEGRFFGSGLDGERVRFYRD